jgi:predicted GTPase
MILSQILPVAALQTIIYRLIAFGTVQLHFPPFEFLKTESFKPVLAVTSFAPNSGKTVLSQSIAKIVSSHGQQIAVILPRPVCDPPRVFEFHAGDSIPSEFPSQLTHEIGNLHHVGVSVVFVTADCRQAVIRSEQCGDLILDDSLQCESPIREGVPPTREHLVEQAALAGFGHATSCEATGLFIRIEESFGS